MSWLSAFSATGRPRLGAGLVFGEPAQGKAQKLELLAGRRKEKIALVARRIVRPVQFGSAGPHYTAGIMPGGQRRGAEIARRSQQVAELDPLIAADAGDRRLAAGVAVDKVVNDGGAKPALVIEHIMRDAEALGNVCGIVDVPTGAAGAPAPRGGAMVVEL